MSTVKKALAYIGSSYHLKRTGSSLFIIDLFRESFQADIFETDNWSHGEIPEKLTVGRYDVVVFWQSVPFAALPKIECKNLVFFPMFDQCGSDRVDEWIRYKAFKIVCFSKNLFNRLSRYGFSCLYVKYFPKPVDGAHGGDLRSLFFWQRRPEINWSTVNSLFPEGTLSFVHWHRALDSAEASVPLNAQATVQVTETTWFENRQEYETSLAQCGLYLAPRLAEGIGFSFLEAMARNMIVIANNESTMNEYIRHGETGYLFWCDRPKPVDLSQAQAVRARLRDYFEQGYRLWLASQPRMIEFIQGPRRTNSVLLPFAVLAAIVIQTLRALKRALLK